MKISDEARREIIQVFLEQFSGSDEESHEYIVEPLVEVIRREVRRQFRRERQRIMRIALREAFTVEGEK